MKQISSILFLFGVVFIQAQTTNPINIWYGNEQVFGTSGQAQYWINILGNVDRDMNWEEVKYQLNGGAYHLLKLGSDKHRLANTGDFNIEIGWADLNEGSNEVLVLAISENGDRFNEKVIVNIIKGKRWELPYEVDFRRISDLQKHVQVVDGNWKLNEHGARTVEPYYDRVLSVGDTTWRNYRAHITLTIHDFTPPTVGPPTYNVTHFGVAFRWRGHVPTPNHQPSRQWFPLGAQGEFLLKENRDSCTWRILYDGSEEAPPQTFTKVRKSIVLGEELNFKAEVETMSDGNTRYRFKQWIKGDAEPNDWDIIGYEDGKNDFESGALCLVPHNSDVTIHSVLVEPISLP